MNQPDFRTLRTEISPEEANEMIEKIARFIVERHLAPAGILFIESVRPLNNIGSQFMYFLLPFAEIIFDSQKYQRFAMMIQNGENVKRLISRIDELDEEMNRERRHANRLKRIRRRNMIRDYIKRLFSKQKNKSAE